MLAQCVNPRIVQLCKTIVAIKRVNQLSFYRPEPPISTAKFHRSEPGCPMENALAVLEALRRAYQYLAKTLKPSFVCAH